MDHSLFTVIGIVLSSVISILGTLAAKQRKEGRDEQLLIDLTKDVAVLEAEGKKLKNDIDSIGGRVREMRVVLGIAGQTGEVPKYVPRDSGEGPALR